MIEGQLIHHKKIIYIYIYIYTYTYIIRYMLRRYIYFNNECSFYKYSNFSSIVAPNIITAYCVICTFKSRKRVKLDRGNEYCCVGFVSFIYWHMSEFEICYLKKIYSMYNSAEYLLFIIAYIKVRNSGCPILFLSYVA